MHGGTFVLSCIKSTVFAPISAWGAVNTESCPSGRRCSTRNAVDRKVSRVRIPNSPPKTQSYQGFCPYDWVFLFSQGHIGVHDFRQELRCASRSALCPAESGYCPLHLPRWSWTCNPNDCKYLLSCRCLCDPATPGFASEAHRSPKAVRRSCALTV